MPLYEFRCESCSENFETLVRKDTAPACPKCGGHHLEKQLSVFAAQTGGAAPSPAMGCGSCGDPRGPGACRMN